jgi:translation initiation factor IF-3
VVVIKEMKLRPKTDVHDLDVKVRAITRFLSEGNKARLVIVFRGREIVHPETGKAVLLKVLAEVAEFALVEQMPLMEGRRMTMLIAPKPGATVPVKKKPEKAATGAKPAEAGGAEEDIDEAAEAEEIEDEDEDEDEEHAEPPDGGSGQDASLPPPTPG